MKTPVIIINAKAYPQSDGDSGLKLIEICGDVSKETGASIIVSPENVLLKAAADMKAIPVMAQSVDAVEPGGRTGWTTLESIKAAGASGTLVNHSEHRLKLADIEYIVSKARTMGLETVVCTNNVGVSRAAVALNPDFVAVEPPELIGGDVSVTTANPAIVSDTVKAVQEINDKVGVLCGAGVKNGKDVKKAIELGAQGVLLASGVVKATNIRDVLIDLVSGL